MDGAAGTNSTNTLDGNDTGREVQIALYDPDRWCSLRCVSGRGDCPGGYECTHLGGIDFFCMPTTPPPAAREQDGCAVGRPSASPGAPGALLLIGALLALGARPRNPASP